MGIQFQAINANETEDHGKHGRFPKRVELDEPFEDPPHLSYAVARAVFGFLGLGFNPEDGDLEIPVLRRAIIRARATSSAEAFEVEPTIQHGAPRVNDDGSVELRPFRHYAFGIEAERILRHVDTLEAYALEAAEAGATHITWA